MIVHQGGRQAFIQVAPAVKLDTIYMPVSHRESKTTVIMCCPNAGSYELGADHYASQYHMLGINVFCWNYRGYGRSDGVPTIATLRSDSLQVLKYVKETLGAEKVVVHGESIGGVAATTLSTTGDVDMLIADRNFWTLPRVAKRLLGM